METNRNTNTKKKTNMKKSMQKNLRKKTGSALAMESSDVDAGNEVEACVGAGLGACVGAGVGAGVGMSAESDIDAERSRGMNRNRNMNRNSNSNIKKLKILLVMPAVEHLRVLPGGDVPKRDVLRFSILPLTTVAALTPDRHEVHVIDENVEPLNFSADYDLVGVSFMTAYAPRAYEIADRFAALGVRTVAGGYHPTFRPEEALGHFDIVVAGEAECQWPRVLDDIAAGSPARIYRNDGPCDSAEIPIPRRDLQATTADHYITTEAVQTGRGCNHKCKFCSITAFFGGVYRSRPLDNVLAELRGVGQNFMFADDNIIAEPEYARQLFRAMAPMKKRWISQCSIEIADDPELLALARKAGCRGLFVGVETLDETNLAAVEKGFNDARNYLRRIKIIRRAGIAVQAGVIVGLDNDDTGVFERTLRFLQKARIDALQLAILTPQPGTPLYDSFESAGRITDRNWSNYDYRHVVIRPAKMSAEQLQDGADWLYRQYYRIDRIVLRGLRTLIAAGPLAGWLLFKLNLTYRYDNKREGVRGQNPARKPRKQKTARNLLAKKIVSVSSQ